MTTAVAVNSSADTAAATLFQRNKHIYINEENTLEMLAADATFLQTFQNWLDASVSQLDGQFERCEQQLAELQQSVAVHGGQYWCGKTIIEHCNLHMSEKRLVKKGAVLEDNYASLPDLINLITCLQQIKSHSFMSVKQRRFIEECEEQLRKVLFEPRDLLFIINALKTKLKDDGNTRGVFGDLTSFQNTIEDLSPDIDECEQLLEASIVNGEMKLAEDISKRQLDVYEHILRLITDQYPVIANYYADSRDSDRRRRWAIFRMVDKDITTVIDCKHRQVEACEEDLHKMNTQIANYTEDDTQQRKRYEADRAESDTFLQQNKDKQHGVWNRIYALYQELQGCVGDLAQLAHERRQEIDRRLHVEEREAGRRSGFNAFLQAAASHARMLQDTIDNALSAKDIAEALNEFVLDGCENIAQKYDKQQNALSEMLQLVQQHHFRRFSDYYIAASRFLYRKERKLNQLEESIATNAMKQEMMAESLNPRAKEFAMENEQLALKRHEVQQEVMYIRHKLEKAESAIAPTLRSLQFAGIEFVHPKEIVHEMNLNRWSTMLDYRALVNPSIPPLAHIRAEEQATLARLKATLEEDSGISFSEDANGTVSSSRRRLHKLAIPLKEYQERTSAQSMFTTHVQSVLDQQQRKLSEYKASSTADGTSNSSNNIINSNNNNRKNNVHAYNNESVRDKELSNHTLHSERVSGRKPHQTSLETKNGKTKEFVKAMSTMPPGSASMANYFKESSDLTLPKIAATQVVYRTRKDDKAKDAGGDVVANSDGSGGGNTFNSLPAMTSATCHNILAAKPCDLEYGQRARRVLPRQMEGAVFCVLYPYKARAPDELNLEENDRVVCISRTAEEG